ncbi:MAG: CcoQ/FixQ family Cbb3-type cytochrome c oxidase assembly chaperone [Alcaligenaceae bacterium]|uniref:CcoQ/FixQ family Cbb3-type cytochrome c oxidase assembly chaperone n=1 Tax=Paenalcaligenes hermetiae TaxID=1157987 RepID=A0ABP9LW20_9BURK|nr:CcoQ/FixQ family Cbb3-type cytochrome c oxidase assembly chaperone [Paenalcaligenes sp.]NLJ61764.1 CcoQ/FixQ family Cbb3-type cytochrome c oxidase assembly chaperone [Alcaligenaceae bacterium]
MVGILNGIATALALLTFLGIVAWAWSKGRAKANHDASMLPFDLPDEVEDQKQKVGGSNE